MEKSFGIIIFRSNTEIEYLLLETKNYWGFPKGHAKEDETEIESAIRETVEETGIKKLEIQKGFYKIIKYEYFNRGKGVEKTVAYFLAKTKQKEVRISDEHVGYIWANYLEARNKVNHMNSKKLLDAANEFLTKKK